MPIHSSGLVKDVISGNKSLGVDVITDFSAGDRLDLRSVTTGSKAATVKDLVQVTDSAEGCHVWAKVGSKFVDVVMLEGVHTDAAHVLASDMIVI